LRAIQTTDRNKLPFGLLFELGPAVDGKLEQFDLGPEETHCDDAPLQSDPENENSVSWVRDFQNP
jgi:hypothetical protein